MLLSNPVSLSDSRLPCAIVVDDMVEIQQLLELWLRDMGYTVSCASSGREASRLLRQQSLDVLITDVIMPDGDGLEVICEAKRRHPQARVLAISGGGLHLHAMDCLKFAKSLGAHGVLLKPFRREQLVNALNAILDQQPA